MMMKEVVFLGPVQQRLIGGCVVYVGTTAIAWASRWLSSDGVVWRIRPWTGPIVDLTWVGSEEKMLAKICAKLVLA